MRWYEWVIAIVALALLLIAPSKPQAQMMTYEAWVINIVDGDTIDVRHDNWTWRVRIADIDTPEVSYRLGAKCEEEIELAKRASMHLRAMLLNEVVIVRVRKIDAYKRHFAYVQWWDLDVGQHLIRTGYAQPWMDNTKRPTWCKDARR